MEESYVEGLAAHNGPESCGGVREGVAEALTGVRTGRVFSRERNHPPECRRRKGMRKATSGASPRQDALELRAGFDKVCRNLETRVSEGPACLVFVLSPQRSVHRPIRHSHLKLSRVCFVLLRSGPSCL